MHPDSMTGFGKSSCFDDNISIVVELKTLNSRYKDLKLILPFKDFEFELKIQKKLKSVFSRGRIELLIKIESEKSSIEDRNIKKLKLLSAKMGKVDLNLSDYLLFNLVEIMNRDSKNLILDEKHEKLILSSVDEAINKTLESRKYDGEMMVVKLKQLIEQLETWVKTIEDISKDQAEQIFEKLQKRVSTLINEKIDKTQLEKEIAFLADKTDITEEILRLNTHLKNFSELLKKYSPVGREMDFLAQEINREINTIGSKSHDIKINTFVVKLKSELEKIKEIAANIE
jgi:uncharacterized protein (TIGR00255 family)